VLVCLLVGGNGTGYIGEEFHSLERQWQLWHPIYADCQSRLRESGVKCTRL